VGVKSLVQEGVRFKAELFLHRFFCWLANGKPVDNKQMADPRVRDEIMPATMEAEVLGQNGC
jgi:hypothetical protein